MQHFKENNFYKAIVLVFVNFMLKSLNDISTCFHKKHYPAKLIPLLFHLRFATKHLPR